MLETQSQKTVFKWICIGSFLLTILLGLRVNGYLGDYGSGIEHHRDHKALAKTEKKICIDGRKYDSVEAPIYKGESMYADDVRQAKKVRKYIRSYLEEKGYEQYTDVLVAICAQESRFGTLDNQNWMQVKGYRGASGMASVKAGLDHFLKDLEWCTKREACTDLNVLVQAYNFGAGYITYCMERGGKDTKELRLEFQAIQRKKTGQKRYGDADYVEKVMCRVRKEEIKD